MEKKIKVIIVDDHDMFRNGIKVLLSSSDFIELQAEARNGKEFIDMLPNYDPDVILMDISMPIMDGFEATKLALEQKPELKILALSMFGEEEYYFRMIKAGVKGFILKSSGISELEKAISLVSKNESYFSNELLRMIIVNLNENNAKKDTAEDASNQLTESEVEILRLVAGGLSNEEIADKLKISTTTIITHRAGLLNKTSCNNTASLVMYAIKNKLVSLE
jgi:DNA-binding NarL/FixJ family response regulator